MINSTRIKRFYKFETYNKRKIKLCKWTLGSSRYFFNHSEQFVVITWNLNMRSKTNKLPQNLQLSSPYWLCAFSSIYLRSVPHHPERRWTSGFLVRRIIQRHWVNWARKIWPTEYARSSNKCPALGYSRRSSSCLLEWLSL